MMSSNHSHTKRTSLWLAALTLAALATPQVQAADKFLIHTTLLNTAVSSSSDALDLEADDDQSVEVDGTYFFTPNLGVNLVATFLTHEVKSAGASLGSIDLLPPVLTLQWHFAPDAMFRPYVAAGFNYNAFSNPTGTLRDLDAEISDEVGLAVGAGFDYMIYQSLSLNLDLKYITFESDVSVGGSKVDELDMDVVLIGVGVGVHF